MRDRRRRSFRAGALAVLLVAALFVGAMAAPLKGQTAAGQVPAAQAPAPPAQTPATQTAATQAPTPSIDDWQKDAGGAQAFDVASVKQNRSGMPPSGDMPRSNFPLGPGAVYSPNGGLFSATNWPLFLYIAFAYKLSSSQMSALQPQLPKWVTADNFDIQAKVDGNPSKDQMRMMMQALLADRFKMTVHTETRQLPVFALVLVKPGKTGPQLQAHPADASCSTAPPAPTPGSAPAAPATIAGGYPEICGGVVGMPGSDPGHFRFGARNVTIGLITTSMTNPLTGVDRPVVDQTGLSGAFDFTIDFSPQLNGPLPAGANFTPDPNGPTFQEALKEQLGLKLDSTTGSVDVFVVDHIELPSEN